jgi:transcription termination factor NusA
MTSLSEDFPGFRAGDLVSGVVQLCDSDRAEVRLGTIEALLPRGEQIPGETFRAGQPIRAIILTMPELGQRSTIILSRTHPDFLRRLFETEIPESWDLEIMTPGKLAEMTTKAIASFTRLDGVDLGLARKLVEQGMLSFRDLSAAPISELVERIDGLSEELAARVVAQAETLADDS